MIAFLFAGQGVEPPWVTPEVLDDPAVASLIAVASRTTGVDVGRLLARGGRQLGRTEVLQPALVAVCLGIHRLLEQAGVQPAIVLGHSLGELAAWASAGGIAPEDAVAIAALRGKLMANEAARQPGGMLRVMADRASCERAMADASRAGSINIAAHNGPGEWVVSGDQAALDALAMTVPSTRLAVSGAWHSPAMAAAVPELEAALAALPPRPLRASMVSNRDGTLADAAEIPRLLAGQLIRPIEWVAALATVAASGARRLIAVGPGKTLRQLVRQNLGESYPVEIIDSLRAVQAARSVHALA